MGRYFVTGGAGFIGSNYVRRLLEAGHEVTNYDLLTYAGVQATVDELDEFTNHTFVHGDIGDGAGVAETIGGHDVVVHFAAESHVDRSIDGPAGFVRTNVLGTAVLLDAAMRAGIQRFVHVSTDEVYGSIPDGSARETDALNPSSPYSSSKAGSDLLARSYWITHEYPVVVTRCTNNYGPYQFPEKVIPLFVTNLLDDKPVPVYGDGSAERDWLHVNDHCSAIDTIIESGMPGEIYNIGADQQLSNLDLTRRILAATGKDDSLVEFVTDRKGHDMRYAVDSTKIRKLGWVPESTFDDRLEETVAWYADRADWWQPLKERA